jgi:SAM-dependent methyltransferase
MSLAERAVLALNALVPDFPQHVTLLEAMADEARHFEWEYRFGQEMLGEWQPALDVRGRRVLDVGSGSGAKSLLYSQVGAAAVVGLEISQHNVTRAVERLRELARSDPAAGRVQMVQGDATRMPFPPANFDLIVSIHAFEHIEPPDLALAECARVLRAGGRAYLRFPPYWSAWGPHLERWVRFPWPHVLFSEPTLIAAANHIETQQHVNDRLPDFVRLDLRGLSRFPHVNHMTMAQFESYVARLPLRIVGLQLLPVGYQFLPRLAQQAGPLASLPLAANAGLHALARTQPGREYLATKAIVVLEKE